MNLTRIEAADNAIATLQASISAEALSLVVYDNAVTDDYENFPGASKLFVITIDNEQILCYGRSSATLTVYDENTHALGELSAGQNGRGYSGTSAASHDGDAIVSLNITTAVVKRIQDKADALEISVSDGLSNRYTKAEIAVLFESKNTKDPVEWTTIGNITLSGLGTQANGEWTSTLLANTRILVKLQTNQVENGTYTAAAGAWARTTDMNSSAEFNAALVPVKRGASNANVLFLQSTDDPVVGTDAIVFSQVGASLNKASQATAEGGVDDNDYMTSLKTKYAIDMLNASIRLMTFGETIAANTPVSTVKEVTTNLAITADTCVKSNSPTSNFSTETSLDVGNYSYTREAYFKFTVPSDCKEIISFTLSTRYTGSYSTTNQWAMRAIISSVNFATVTWNTKPDLSIAMAFSATPNVQNPTTTFAVIVGGKGNSDAIIANGFALQCTSSGSYTFYSTEGSVPPTISTITYVGYDGKIYKAKATSQTGVNSFCGFTKEAGNLNDVKRVQFGGVIPVGSLTELKDYFLSDTAGQISTIQGTFRKLVGRSIDTTNLLNMSEIGGQKFVSSDNLIGEKLGGALYAATTYGERLSLKSSWGGVVKIKFSIGTNGTVSSVSGRIYVNGVAVGTERTTTSSTPVEFAEEITIQPGDKISIYSLANTNSYYHYVGYIRAYADKIAGFDMLPV